MRKEKDTIERKVVCINQLRSSRSVKTYANDINWLGYGNCSICEYDPINNPKCEGYVPVNFVILNLKK